MKIKSLFLSMSVALTLVGCNSVEEPNGGTDTSAGGTGYVAVNIVQPKAAGTRATGDFENGSAAENNASEGLFFILNAGGDVQTIDGKTAQRVSLEGEGSMTKPAVERIYNAVLLIDGVENDPTSQAKYIVCILNAPAGLETGVTNLSDLRAKVADYCTDHITDGTFVMSNSVYRDASDNMIIGTPVTADKIKKSQIEATSDPVEIYVERVVAKVRAAEKDGGITNEGAKVTVDGVEHTYKINIKGMTLANLTDKAYLIKNLPATFTTTATWQWNDPENRRSFWEVLPDGTNAAQKVTVNKQSWDDIESDTHYTPTNLVNGKYCFNQYILPNTFSKGYTGGNTIKDNSTINTAIVIAAQLTETVDGTEKPADLVWIRGGYTTNNGALTTVAKSVATVYSDYYKKTGENSYSQLAAEDFTWIGVEGEGYSCYAKLKDQFGTDNKIYKKTGENTYVEETNGVTTVNTYLSTPVNNLKARKYTDGKCYYYVEIEHVAGTTGANPTAAIKGVVRNHIYDLTLNSIQGIGIPVFDPTDQNIPEDPQDDNLFYLGARVNVLDWRLVSQGVDFGKN